MLENRSFDNLLGWLYNGEANPDVNLSGEPGDVKFHGLTPELLEKFAQPLKTSSGSEQSLPIIRGVKGNLFPYTTPIIDPEEPYEPVIQQLFNQKEEPPEGTPATMLGFLQNYYDDCVKKIIHPTRILDEYKEILNTYDFDEAPVINSLAKNYAVSDLWFSSIPSQTSINRAYSICGDSVGYAKEGDKEKTALVVNNVYNYPPFKPANFSGKTIWEVLCDNGKNTAADWRIYYSSNYLPFFPLEYFYSHSYTYEMFPSLRDILDGKAPNSVASPADEMYKQIESFYEDAAKGDLPAFTYLEPSYSWNVLGDVGVHIGDDYHPPGDIRTGEKFLARVYNALRESPDWEETLLIVSFDEHGGTFDHMAPPWGAVNPGGADVYQDGFKFNRLGVRVPTLFISPWVEAGTVIRSSNPNTPFEHTSWLATLLNWFELDPALLGARTGAAPTFEAVVGDQTRAAFELGDFEMPASEHKGEEALTTEGAMMVSKILAGADSGVDSRTILKDIMSKCKTLADLRKYYEQKLAGKV